MILKVLKEINENGNFSSKIISNNLNIPVNLIDHIKGKLIAMEYIEKVNLCSNICDKCACGCSNKSLNDKEDYNITEKGMKVIKGEKINDIIR